MIGNCYPLGNTGYTLLEEGRLDPGSLQLIVECWLVCRPDGSEYGRFAERQAAERAVEALPAGDLPAE